MGCASKVNYIFKDFMVLFDLLGLSVAARNLTGPCWSCLRGWRSFPGEVSSCLCCRRSSLAWWANRLLVLIVLWPSFALPLTSPTVQRRRTVCRWGLLVAESPLLVLPTACSLSSGEGGLRPKERGVCFSWPLTASGAPMHPHAGGAGQPHVLGGLPSLLRSSEPAWADFCGRIGALKIWA